MTSRAATTVTLRMTDSTTAGAIRRWGGRPPSSTTGAPLSAPDVTTGACHPPATGSRRPAVVRVADAERTAGGRLRLPPDPPWKGSGMADEATTRPDATAPVTPNEQ